MLKRKVYKIRIGFSVRPEKFQINVSEINGISTEKSRFQIDYDDDDDYSLKIYIKN